MNRATTGPRGFAAVTREGVRIFAGGALALAIFAGPAGGQALPQPKPFAWMNKGKPSGVPQSASKQTSIKAAPLKLRGNMVAKELFGKVSTPAALRPNAFGSYARGCQAGAVSLPENGDAWQVMRLSRNRFWGQPELIDYLKDLADDVPGLGWRGLMVGDMAQPRGGPMLTGHASHQIGLDADIWLKQMPDHVMSARERENVSAVSMLRGPLNVAGANRTVDPKKFTVTHARLIRRAAKDKRVARIFVSPGIKKALCEFETGDRSWLRVIRPWWGHHYHFHVRLKCPAGSKGCKNQNLPPPGDGCGKPLTYWMSDEPWVPKKGTKPGKPKPPMTLAALPKACVDVLTAQ